MEKQKTIYDLELHEFMYLDALVNVCVIRVHGGFIYNQTVDNSVYFHTSTFVPYDPPLILTSGRIDGLPEKDNSPRIYFDPE